MTFTFFSTLKFNCYKIYDCVQFTALAVRLKTYILFGFARVRKLMANFMV